MANYYMPAPGESDISGGGDSFWNQYQQAPNMGGVTLDPSQRSANTGINGGNTLPPIGSMGGTPIQTMQPGGQGDPEAFRAAWFASPFPKTTDGLKQFVAANPQYGAQITGSKGSKVIVGGQAFQAVRSAGLGGGIGPAWDPLGAEGGGGGGQGSALAGLGYNFGDAMTPFKPPTAEEALNSPGLQYALGEANRMMQNGAAAKGTLLNGRFQQALGAANTQNALQGYQGVFDRAYQTHVRNQDAPFNKNLSLAELGKPT